MHQQTVKNPPLKFGKGILAVATLMVMVIADSVLTQMLEPWLGAGTAVVIFWVLGALIAMYAMRRYVMSFSYAANGNMLQITFAYGRYRRMMEEIYYNNMLYSGSLEDMKKRCPGARVNRATRPGCELEAFAVAYRSNGKPCIMVLQPDEKMKEIIVQATKKKK